MSILNKQLIQQKFKAMGIHFLISLGIFLMLALWIGLILYPDMHITMSGGVQGLWLMFMVDVVLGPVLTLMIYNPSKGKREKILDFSTIGAVQLSALLYGLWTVYIEHPKAIMMYDMGTAAVFNYQDLKTDEKWQQIDEVNTKWHGLPVVYYHYLPEKDDVEYVDLAKMDKEILLEVEKTVRFSMNEKEKEQLAELEKTHGKLWAFAIMGKYRGAFLILDKDFQIIAKIGEKPVG